MPSDTQQTIADLLVATGSAHGDYEQAALGGAYDTDWAAWYAAYLIAHDLGPLLNSPEGLDAAHLAGLLTAYDAAYQQEHPADPWPLDYARRLLAEFAPTPTHPS